MPNPKEVFECPQQHWNFLTAKTDTEFEDQYFDRKEVGRVKTNGFVDKTDVQKIISEIMECVSAFANSNKDGGLLVLGISTGGAIKGINHLTDQQRNSITHIDTILSNQAAKVKFVDCHNESGFSDRVCLIYVPYTEYGICETLASLPKAWIRQGAQNLLLNQSQRDQLRRDKKIVDFEQAYCCPYDPHDIDQAVLKEYRESYLSRVGYDYNDEELLYQVGALIRDGQGYAFSNAGFLFFTSNPQRKLTTSFIRLLRFEATSEQIAERRLPTFERSFGGPITKQIRDIRTFFQQSGFFKIYQKRNMDGGFAEEPEYPYITIDEAIVNAAAHRDYAINLPIECESYKDAFIVSNPGRILQRDRDVPEQFSLDATVLVSTPRNPKLIEWLKIMRDPRGTAFVRALSEGTKRMRDEMATLNLPAPIYRVKGAQTTVTLFSKAAEREALLQSAYEAQPTQFANLFPLTFLSNSGQREDAEFLTRQRQDFMTSLKDALVAKKWYIDSFRFGRLIAHRQGSQISLPDNVAKIVRFSPAYVFQLRHYWGHSYLCIDYTLELRNARNVQALLTIFQPSSFVGATAVAQWNGWQRGKIISADQEWTCMYFFDFGQEEQISSNKVIPNLSKSSIEQVLHQQGVRFDLHRAIKQHSLSLEPGAARIRVEKTQITAKDIAETIFPLAFKGVHVFLQAHPVPLPQQANANRTFQVRSVPEPKVEFNHHEETDDIREGITKFGAYDSSPKMIELVPICTPELRLSMAALIDRLKAGKYKYRGSERTFSTRLTYTSIITVSSTELTINECKRLLNEHPEWIANDQLNRLFLVYTPEKGYTADDERSPYYRIKRLLLEHGIPCQMLDTPTLLNPDWKDLNLALNITAKCGVTPWVLPDAIPDADFFVGLSYTQGHQKDKERLMGYANVFNQYGRWMFYSGNTSAFAYDERTKYYQELIQQTLERLTLSETPSIYFHYSAKFSREDRMAILKAARSVRPQGIYSFVWINAHHNLRLYDSRVETDGSLSRGSYVITSPNQLYLSTTGYNPYRKVLGTPQMLEINIRIERPEGIPNSDPDLTALAAQVLNLTKLNWSSTDSLCGEPITTKYAGDIAYLTAAFLRQDQTFRLHRILEKTPWFI